MKKKTICLIIAAAMLLSIVSCTPEASKFKRKVKHVSSSDLSVSSQDAADHEHQESSGFNGDEDTTASKQPGKKVQDTDLVRVKDYILDVDVELLYATERNFTGKVIYSFDEAWLRYGTVKKLKKAQKLAKKEGYSLKIWDAFRPVSAQFDLWNEFPHPKYVSDPNKGFSAHSRGNTVDVTLVDDEGWELEMPSGFDSFSRLADRDYSDVKNRKAVVNAELLENIMKECGFKPYAGEWWHFTDSEKYDVEMDFLPQ